MTPAQRLMLDAVKFMASNIVVVDWDGDAIRKRLRTGDYTQGTHLMYLHKLNQQTAVGQTKDWFSEALPVYKLRRTDTAQGDGAEIDGNSISVYFCPYRGGRTLGTVVGSQASLFFTSEMDGCSLGFGSVTPEGARLVYHSNASQPVATLQSQSDVQHTDLTGVFGNLPLFTRLQDELSPMKYRLSNAGTEYKSTTFGVRQVVAGWKFYTHRYASERKGQKWVYTLKGVTPVSF